MWERYGSGLSAVLYGDATPRGEAEKMYAATPERSYNLDEGDGAQATVMPTFSLVGDVVVRILVYLNGFSVYSTPAVRAAADNAMRVAEYFTYCNHRLPYGNFEIDIDSGRIRFKAAMFCHDAINAQDARARTAAFAVAAWERYGDGLISVIQDGASPKEAAAKVDAQRCPRSHK
jgi:hypothetical protein